MFAAMLLVPFSAVFFFVVVLHPTETSNYTQQLHSFAGWWRRRFLWWSRPFIHVTFPRCSTSSPFFFCECYTCVKFFCVFFFPPYSNLLFSEGEKRGKTKRRRRRRRGLSLGGFHPKRKIKKGEKPSARFSFCAFFFFVLIYFVLPALSRRRLIVHNSE